MGEEEDCIRENKRDERRGRGNEDEYRSKRKIDAFEILKRVPVFTGDGTDDVEEWIWKGWIMEPHF